MAALQAAMPPCKYAENKGRLLCTTHDGLCTPAFCEILDLIITDPTMPTLAQLQQACWALGLDTAGEPLTAAACRHAAKR